MSLSSSSIEETDHQDNEFENAGGSPQFKPIVSLPLVDTPTNEEEEEELVKIHAQLYRYDTANQEWKERGTGDIKLLQHKQNNTVRVVMRRDKTLKICANHFITPDIQMNVHCGSDKAFIWSVFADFADETCKQELLAIRFGNTENAILWRTKFAEAQEIVRTKCSKPSDDNSSGITRSEDTTTPEPQNMNKLENKKVEDNVEGVVIKLKELKTGESQKQE